MRKRPLLASSGPFLPASWLSKAEAGINGRRRITRGEGPSRSEVGSSSSHKQTGKRRCACAFVPKRIKTEVIAAYITAGPLLQLRSLLDIAVHFGKCSLSLKQAQGGREIIFACAISRRWDGRQACDFSEGCFGRLHERYMRVFRRHSGERECRRFLKPYLIDTPNLLMDAVSQSQIILQWRRVACL